MQGKHRRGQVMGWACAMAWCWAGAAPMAWADAPIELRYNERPPFQVTGADGKLGGTVGTLAQQAFADAGLPYVLIVTPFNRQRAIVEANRVPSCMIGWRRTAERARIGKFTVPLADGKLQGAVTRADNPYMKNGGLLQETLGNRALRLLVKDNYSVGDELDGAIARAAPPRLHTTVESRNMLEMLLLGRADYMFMSEEEVAGVIAAPGSGLKPDQFRYIHFADLQARVDRRLWCSQIVPDAVIERLNAAIVRRRAAHGGVP